MREPRVFTIPPEAPFLPTLADALLAGTLSDGWPTGVALADAVIYLPTRRAGSALAAILTQRSGGQALLLPRIVPLGDIPEGLGDAGHDEEAGLPERPPIPALERRLILARLVQHWAARLRAEGAAGAPSGSPADAVALAGDLEGLMDSLAVENVPWEALAGVVDTEHSDYFATTLRFVRIAHEAWPAILGERGASDPARSRHEAALAEAARLATDPPPGPVIAAGSTGSMPATAALLAAIARLPRGAVVLPGLDLDLDAAAWDAIGGPAGATREPLWGHPQFMLRRLLTEHLRVAREAVRVLESVSKSAARRRLMSQVMRPAELTDGWAAMPAAERSALAAAGTANVALIVAGDEREEALAVAVALRETLEEPGRTVALVTPDRGLARRVAAELERWGVTADDSAGLALADTEAGRLARLAAEAVASCFDPVRLLALLAHPAATLGLSRAKLAEAAAFLEIAVLRGPKPRSGLGGLAAALESQHGARGRRDPVPRQCLSDRDWDAARDLIRRLRRAFAPLAWADEATDMIDLVACASGHADVLGALIELAPSHEGEAIAGLAAVFGLLEEMTLASDAGIDGRLADYPAFFAAIARERSVPPEPGRGHRRLKILGLLEARLLDLDRVVLGGLDESIWPPTPESDALLNRPMRLALGLSPPERRLGQTAHDFVQAFGAREVVLTRARKRDGKPTVPSRLLERLNAFAGAEANAAMIARGDRYRAWAAALDEPRPTEPIPRPEPRPGADRFPRNLSVTEIETLIRDPYSIYARHILRLTPLDPIAAAPSGAERGSILHSVLGDFAELYPTELPDDAAEKLAGLARTAFRGLEEAYPELYALWQPEFERIAPHFVAWERERRTGLGAILAEKGGQLEIRIEGETALTLRGRADRIELGEGASAIVDFKSGTVPSDREIGAGFSPQLTLEAAMLMAGGFADAPAGGRLPALVYVKLGGRARLAAREVAPARGDSRSMTAIVEAHVRGLESLARRYGQDGEGYASRPFPQFLLGYAAYDHLARVKEWAAAAEPDGDTP